MLHIRKVIQKISEKESKEFIFWLNQNNAGKLAHLFLILRENIMEESAIANELETSPTGFYTLKSRLNTKMQEFFAHNTPDNNIDLLRNVANIPNLLFNAPREIAILNLLKMEKELIEYDMPHALTTVYSALKKLTRNSKKYFDYTQLYNKHLAYTMALDKAKELLADFNKTLGEYLMSYNAKLFEVLGVIRQEMQNYAQLYDSHHLMVYQNILDVEYALFAVPDEKDESGISADELLIKTGTILKSYKSDTSYFFMSPLINFLWFQYFHQQGLNKKALEYFNQVNNKLSVFLLNTFCCFPSQFLISKAEWYLDNNKEKKLYEESKLLSASFSPDAEDTPNYINYVKHQAIAAYYSKKYNESVMLLNELFNTISFRNFPHAEIEIKLFLIVCYLLVNKTDLATGLLKNIQRKVRDLDPGIYENAKVFTKLLSLIMDRSVKGRGKKMIRMRNKFQSVNQKQGKILVFLRLDDAFLKSISMAIT